MPVEDCRGNTASDLRTILRIQALRAFLYGLGSVLIGVTLAGGGLTDAQVGAVFTAILIGMALASWWWAPSANGWVVVARTSCCSCWSGPRGRCSH